jgi:hypothetical protein
MGSERLSHESIKLKMKVLIESFKANDGSCQIIPPTFISYVFLSAEPGFDPFNLLNFKTFLLRNLNFSENVFCQVEPIRPQRVAVFPLDRIDIQLTIFKLLFNDLFYLISFEQFNLCPHYLCLFLVEMKSQPKLIVPHMIVF